MLQTFELLASGWQYLQSHSDIKRCFTLGGEERILGRSVTAPNLSSQPLVEQKESYPAMIPEKTLC